MQSLSRLTVLCVVTLIWFHAVQETSAAIKVWDGDAQNSLFSTKENWNGNTLPATDDQLQFGPPAGAVNFFTLDQNFAASTIAFLNTAPAYNVSSATGFEVLTLNLIGAPGVIGLVNSSTLRQNFSSVLVTIAADQTWDAGNGGLNLAQIDLGNTVARTLTVTGSGTTASNRVLLSGVVTGPGSIVKDGVGSLLFAASGSDYSGTTSVKSGTFQLGTNNVLPNSSKLILSGGTFDTNNFSDRMAALDLDNNATLSFGGNGSLTFDPSNGESWNGNLTITNFGAGDTFRVGTSNTALTGAQLNQILFDGTTPAQIDGDGYVTRLVPEPNILSLFFFSVGGLSGLWRRRR